MAAVYSDLTYYDTLPDGKIRWAYATTDDVATAQTIGYWDDIAKALRSGDWVMVTASDGKYIGHAVFMGPATAFVNVQATVTAFF